MSDTPLPPSGPAPAEQKPSSSVYDDPPSARAQRRAAVVRWILIGGFGVLAVIGVLAGIGFFEPPAESQGVVWTCPMHPQVRQDSPGQCPICGMNLVRAQPAAPPSSGHPPPAGHVAVAVDTATLGRIGVVVTPVEHGTISDSVRAPARIELDPRHVSVVDVRLGGWLRNVRPRATGFRVRRGQALARLVSTDLYQAESDLAAAQRSLGALGASGAAVMTSARERLAALGVPAREVARVAAGGAPSTSLSVIAPQSGEVVDLAALEGAYVAPGTALFTIADTSRLWVVASLPIGDAARVSIGTTARVDSVALPGRTFDARVVLLDPNADPTTRTRGVRLEVTNPDAALAPGMDVTILVAGTDRHAMLLPADAVLPGRDESYVYVEVGQGRFEPRAVHPGATTAGRTEILSGLDGTERVASVGAFLLDAESRLRAVGSGGEHAGHDAQSAPPTSDHAGHGGE